MNSTKIKKTLIKLLPYIIVGLVCTNLGEAWRLAEGADLGKKMLSFFSMVGVAVMTWKDFDDGTSLMVQAGQGAVQHFYGSGEFRRAE